MKVVKYFVSIFLERVSNITFLLGIMLAYILCTAGLAHLVGGSENTTKLDISVLVNNTFLDIVWIVVAITLPFVWAVKFWQLIQQFKAKHKGGVNV